MTNNQNKGEKCVCGAILSIVADNHPSGIKIGDKMCHKCNRVYISTPQSVEKELRLCPKCNTMKNMEFGTTECRQCFETSTVEEEECWHREITSDGLNAQCTKCKQEFAPKDSFFEIKICTRCGNNEFRAIPQSTTLGTTMEEEREMFYEKFGWRDSLIGKIGIRFDWIADYWIERMTIRESQSKAETIKEIYMHASLYSDGSYTLLHDYLKQKYPDILTLLSKDIEQ